MLSLGCVYFTAQYISTIEFVVWQVVVTLAPSYLTTCVPAHTRLYEGIVLIWSGALQGLKKVEFLS